MLKMGSRSIWSAAVKADNLSKNSSRAVSSAGERFPDTEEVAGSIPAPPTIFPFEVAPTTHS